MLNYEPRNHFNGLQQTALVLLRIAIGWHFLREGVLKLSHPTWSAVGYLSGSWGPLSPLFNWIAETPSLLSLSDTLMPWMLTIAGLGLMLGLFTRFSSVLAMGLLAMFFMAAPPINPTIPVGDAFEFSKFMGNVAHAQWAGKQLVGCEGNYLGVNKNLIELLAIGALMLLNTGRIAGLDALINQYITGPMFGIGLDEEI